MFSRFLELFFSEEQEISHTDKKLTKQSNVKPHLLKNFKRITRSIIREIRKHVPRSQIIRGNSSCKNSRKRPENLRCSQRKCNMHPRQSLLSTKPMHQEPYL